MIDFLYMSRTLISFYQTIACENCKFIELRKIDDYIISQLRFLIILTIRWAF
jgi:hypothetical protein